jgi:simple sugar transport system permease protein
LTYALDRVWQAPFIPVLIAVSSCVLGFLLVRRIRANRKLLCKPYPQNEWVFIFNCAICVVLIGLGLHGILFPSGTGFLPASPITGIGDIPVVTGLVIVAFCLFTHYFTKTKLGQDCRSVGQSQHIAGVSGINTDRTRVIATMISTVVASWGMIVFLQNIGTVNTYTSQEQVGMSSVAALLAGGATLSGASVGNALTGLVLFHAMCIVSPDIGRLFSANEGVGEYTRSFMQSGVIVLALVLYILKSNKAGKE